MIIDSTRDKMMAFRKKNRPEMRSIMGQCRNEIKSILTGKQKVKFKALRKRGKKRFGRQGRKGGNSMRDKGKGFSAFEPSPGNPQTAKIKRFALNRERLSLLLQLIRQKNLLVNKLLSPSGFKTLVFRRRRFNGSGTANNFNTLNPLGGFCGFFFFSPLQRDTESNVS